MKLIRITLLVLLAVGVSLTVPAAENANPSWDKLKSLVGDWEGTYEGQPARVSYKVVSNGTALMESMENPDSSQMITVYHPDGASLLMTHYCSMGNQPRMRSKGVQNGQLDFAYVDAANLKSPDEPRMTRLVMSFPDSDHLIHEWTSKTGTQEHVARFQFARKK